MVAWTPPLEISAWGKPAASATAASVVSTRSFIVAYCRRFRSSHVGGAGAFRLPTGPAPCNRARDRTVLAELTRNVTLCYHCNLIHIRPIRFVLIFACSLLIGFGVLVTPQAQSVTGKFSRALVSVSHGLIRMCGGPATQNGAILRAPG